LPERRLSEPLVRVYLIQPMTAEIIDDGPGRKTDVTPTTTALTRILQARLDRGDSFFSV
jgi:hypothetical protein